MVFETEETAAFEIENAEMRVISGVGPIEIGEEQPGVHKFGAKAHVNVFDDNGGYAGDEYLQFIVYARSQEEAAERVNNFLMKLNEELVREGEGEVEAQTVSVWMCESDCLEQ